jgi:hypothetical protein
MKRSAMMMQTLQVRQPQAQLAAAFVHGDVIGTISVLPFHSLYLAIES